MVDIAIYDVHKRYIFMWKSHNNNSPAFGALRFPYAGMTFLRVKFTNASLTQGKLMVFGRQGPVRAWDPQQ